MKRIFTKISLYGLVISTALLTGCLGDEIRGTDDGSGSDTTDSTIPGNSVIDARVFEALNLDLPELASVKAYYESDQYYLAAQALLNYFRTRTQVNANVNLIAPSITAEEQARADWALPVTGDAQDGYRFWVDGYADGDRPYSYQTGSKLDWTKRATAETEERFRLHRLQWMIPQGKAYRTTLDENYVTSWMSVYESWLETFPLPAGDYDFNADPSSQPEEVREALYAWRPIDVSYRLADQCDLIYYFMQSTAFTPQMLASYLSNLVEQAGHVMNHYSENGEELAQESYAVWRAGTIFPEMKQAAEWVKSGSQAMNDGVDISILNLLDLSYGGLSKVSAAYAAGDYRLALQELLNYYRTRTHGLNPNVKIESDKATDTEKSWADYAFRENGYRFYVKNYFDASAGSNVPYSYLNAEGTGIDWTIWPTKEQEHRYQLHRHQWMILQGKAYNATHDERYVANWMEVYGDWLRQNPKPDVDLDYTVYPENLPAEYRNAGWSWRPLDVAARVIDQCGLLEYYQNSETVTAEWLSTVLKHLDEQVNHIMKNYSTTSNHLITQAQAVTFAGMLFPELKNAATWRTNGPGVLGQQVTAQYFNDGWLKDGDLSYHISGIEDFRSSLLVAQLNGGESYFPSNFVSSMRKMTDVVMNMIYPDYSVPNMADTRAASWTKSVLTRNLKNYMTLFPDNAGLTWLATEGAQGTQPTTNVVTFPDGGYYVMRTGWTMQDLMMVLQNTPDGPSEQWHRQSDNNTFELWAKGRNFFPDSGAGSYGGSSETNAIRSRYGATTAHNTLTLDGKNVASDGRMLKQESKSTSSYAYEVLVLENPSYTGLTHRRTIFLVNNKFYVILDEGYGSAEGTVNLNFNVTPGDDSQVALDSSEGGFHTAFGDGNNLYVRSVSDKEMTFAEKQGFVAYNVVTSSYKETARKAYQLNVTKSASDEAVRYVTVLYPTTDATAVKGFESDLGEWSASGASISVRIDGKTYNLSYTL